MANFTGTNGNDTLIGTPQDDQMFGLAGNDVIEGEKGNDLMDGGIGNDVLGWDDGDGSDRMIGGDGYDIIEVEGAVTGADTFTLGKNGLNQAIFDRIALNGDTTRGTFKLTVDTAEEFKVSGLGGNDSFTVGDLTGTGVQLVRYFGGDGNDTLAGSTEGNVTSTKIVAFGETGDDELNGGLANDELYGGIGNDKIGGEKGNDLMVGEAGNDVLEWDDGDGSDRMIGGDGYDIIEVEGAVEGADTFTLGKNGLNQAIFDRIALNGDTTRGTFKLTVDTSEEFEVSGLGGNDSFTVSDLSNTGVQKVKWSGDNGDDLLDARSTNVVVEANGGSGRDTLIGGKANDILTGGTGADLFRFDTGRGYQKTDIGVDRITDFQVGTDKIVLDRSTFLKVIQFGRFFASVDTDAQADNVRAAIVYSRSTGNLFYNTNGTRDGWGKGGKFATIDSDNNAFTPPPILSASDFRIAL